MQNKQKIFLHIERLKSEYYSQVLLSPGNSFKSQNKIFGFVFNTTCPLSCCHGTNVVSIHENQQETYIHNLRNKLENITVRFECSLTAYLH